MNEFNIVLYLSVKRGFIFNEWLSYYLLYNLWQKNYMFSLSAFLAILFNGMDTNAIKEDDLMKKLLNILRNN